MKRLTRWTLVVAVFACGLYCFAGPFDKKALKTEDEKAPVQAGPDNTKTAFFYNGGKKIALEDSGLGIAKIKPNAKLEKTGVQPTTLAPGNPLRELQDALGEANMVIVNTSGPSSLDLSTAATDHPEVVEFILPVCETHVQGNVATMVMTPRITARFQNRETTVEAAAEYVRPFGLKVKEKQSTPGAFLLELEGKITYDRLLNAANRLCEKGVEDGRLRYSHPDFIPLKSRKGAIADPNFSRQWHLHNKGGHGGTANADVRAVDAWEITEGIPDVRVAILDDSIDRDHPDLKGNFVAGRYYNGVAGTFNNDPSPRVGREMHGTSCAGVAVACANDVGGRGIAPKCGLIGIHFWNASVAQTSDAFYFSDQQGAAIVSCSWSWQSPEVFVSLRQAIDDLAVNGRNGKGMLVLFAAGNEYSKIAERQQFGSLGSVICVGATNWKDDHSPYSNHGPELDIVAPSNDVDTPGALSIDTTDNSDGLPKLPGRTYSGYATGDYTGNGSTGFGGTSSATPLVAGVCALILSANPALTGDQVRQILYSTADKIPGVATPANYHPTTGMSEFYGHGRVNAHKAVVKAIQTN